MSGGGPERVDIALALPLRDGRVLVARRAAGVHLGGAWEFPGGRVAPGETPAAAAARELFEETALVARELEPLVTVVHDYADVPLRFHVFLARDPAGDVRVDGGRDFTWLTWPELDALEMPEANRPMVRALRWRIGAP